MRCQRIGFVIAIFEENGGAKIDDSKMRVPAQLQLRAHCAGTLILLSSDWPLGLSFVLTSYT